MRQKWSLLVVGVLVFTFLAPSSQPLFALSEEQREVFESNIYYFDVNDNNVMSAQCGGSGVLVGSDNTEKGYNFFIEKGLEPIYTAAFIGNFLFESGMKPEAFNSAGGGSGAYGIAQWRGGRQEGLRRFAEQQGGDYADLQIQLEYVWTELQNGEQGAYERILATDNLEDATIAVDRYYERSEQTHHQERIDYAVDVLTRFGDGSGTQSTSNTVVCGDANGYSLPVDNIWYEQNPEWFTKPHHDYPAADIPVPTNTPIFSMTAGTIVKAPTGGACGTGVVVETEDGVRFTYCHGIDGGTVTHAREGDQVHPGQLIMHSGNTGRSSGPHLHLAINLDGNRCPQDLFVGIYDGSPPEINSLPTSGCTY